MDFEIALNTFVASTMLRNRQYMTEKFAILTEKSELFVKIDSGRKFIRIVSGNIDLIDGKEYNLSVYCFVAKDDGYSNTLGSYKKGDILKAASWKVPARHARGNIFNDDNGLSATNQYGANYMR